MLIIITIKDTLRYIDCKTSEQSDRLYEEILTKGFIDVSKLQG